MTGTVPHWIEQLLGIKTSAGEGTAWNIECFWAWPAWLTLLCAVAAVVFVAAMYLREGRGNGSLRLVLAAIRLGLVALVLMMIAQPTLSLKRTGLPYAAVLVDDSLSMTAVDHYASEPRQAMLERLKDAGLKSTELSRWNLVGTLLTENKEALLRGIAEDHKLRFFFLSDVRPSRQQEPEGMAEETRSIVPTGRQTRLGAGIRAVLDEFRGTTPAAIVLLTDGVNTEGPSLAEAAESARRRSIPLFFIGLGSQEPPRDIKLSDLLVDDVVFVDDPVTFECKLSASGFQGEKVAVVLREKGQAAVLAKVEATLGADGQSQQVRVPFRPSRVGQFEFVLEAQPQPGELQTENNRQARTIQVRREKIRVLLVQAYPSFEFRYLRNMLRRDGTIKLETVLQEGDLQGGQEDASALRVFPLRREELWAYDVIIFGDVNPALLGAAALQNLADFVDQPGKGGALVLLAGPSFMPAQYGDTPLARLLPFAPQAVRYPVPQTLKDGFVVRPTDLGLASPALQLGDNPQQTQEIWRNLAPLYWLLELPELKPGVRVLAEHPTRLGPAGRRLPVFCLQYVGAGKVLFHATDETWRWRYRSGDAYFARYWIQTIRDLCRTKLSDADRVVLLSTDGREYAQGEPVLFRARFSDQRLAPAEDDGVTVAVELAGRQTQRLQLHRAAVSRGLFEGTLSPSAPGDYHAWIVAPALERQGSAADFTVTPPAGEFAQICMDAAEMRRAAEQTGGGFYTFETAQRLPADLPRGQQVPVESLPPRPLWNTWPVLALFLMLIIAEWVLRKRGGMI